jgi:hypothetical protein
MVARVDSSHLSKFLKVSNTDSEYDEEGAAEYEND